MNRSLIALATLASVVLCAHCWGAAPVPMTVSGTTINVQHDGAPAFCATDFAGVNGSTWSFTGNCSEPPPYNPPHDPNALTNIIGKFASHSCGGIATSNGEDFGALFGQLEGGNAILPYPYRPNSIYFSIPAGPRIYGGVINMPANPGTVRHNLKADAYGGNCRPALNPTGAPMPWRVLGIDNTPAPTGVCSGFLIFSNAAFLSVNPSASPATDNHTMCNFRPSGKYRVVLDPSVPTVASVILTWN